MARRTETLSLTAGGSVQADGFAYVGTGDRSTEADRRSIRVTQPAAKKRSRRLEKLAEGTARYLRNRALAEDADVAGA